MNEIYCNYYFRVTNNYTLKFFDGSLTAAVLILCKLRSTLFKNVILSIDLEKKGVQPHTQKDKTGL